MVGADAEEIDYVVDQSGNGDYESVQAAIDGAKSFPPERITILLREGTYDEKVKVHSWNPQITLLGEGPETTILTHDDHFGKIGRGRNSTFFTYTLKVCGNDFHARNLTVRNSAGPERGQAIAAHVEADRTVFHNCRLRGNQDTVYAAGEGCRQYFSNCYIDGTTDFVFGGGTAVFEGCEIRSKADSYITAASTPQTEPFGYVFRDCTFSADPEVSEVYLGRPWRDYARVAVIQSELGDHIRPEGWHNWGRPAAEDTVTYVEYENRGPGAVAQATRVHWSSQLTSDAAGEYSTKNVLRPEDAPPSERPWHEISVQ